MKYKNVKIFICSNKLKYAKFYSKKENDLEIILEPKHKNVQTHFVFEHIKNREILFLFIILIEETD